MDCRHLKPIYLIDVWTLSVGLTSGANCKLDFFFSLSPQYRLCCYVTSVCHHSTTISRGITQYTDIMNSPQVKCVCVCVGHLLTPSTARRSHGGRMETKRVIDGAAKEMVWKRMLRQAVDRPGIDLILCSPLI